MYKKVRVPASSANLGPGFDTLALALPLYLTVSMKPSKSLEVISKAAGKELSVTKDHLIYKVIHEVVGHTNVTLTIDSKIPLARGLGSSGALVVAIATALKANDPLAIAYKFEHHIENAAASYYGGLVAAKFEDGVADVMRLSVDERLRVVVIVPKFEIKTEDARKVLPKSYSREKVIKNLSNVLFLTQGFRDLNYLKFAYFRDFIHQPYRFKLFPEAKEIIEYSGHLGAYGAALSGSGSSLIVFTDYKSTKKVALKLESFLEQIKLDCDIYSFKPDLRGIQIY